MALLFIRFSPEFACYIFIILVYTNHISNEKHMHHGILAPWAYLCSTSLNWYIYEIKVTQLEKNHILASVQFMAANFGVGIDVYTDTLCVLLTFAWYCYTIMYIGVIIHDRF